jgi:hypothetical protein
MTFYSHVNLEPRIGKRGTTELVTPTPFRKERAEEILAECQKKAGCTPWSDQLDKVMTDGEYAFVKSVWDFIPNGNSSFANAFFMVMKGEVIEAHEIYHAELAKLED